MQIISGAAFADCKNLKKVVFEGDRMDELSGCFQRCTALQSVTLPRNVGKMTAEMFYGCTNLTSVRLPDNLKELPQHTFMDCAKLTTVTVPASVTRMGNDVFDGSGVVSLDLSHVMEFDEFGSIGCCANLKNLKLNAKLKNAPFIEVYSQVQDCPQSSALGAWAQKRIKAIDITIEQPEVGTPIWNGEAQAAIKVKSIITDAFGSQNMLGEEKIKADNVQQGKIWVENGACLPAPSATNFARIVIRNTPG